MGLSIDRGARWGPARAAAVVLLFAVATQGCRSQEGESSTLRIHLPSFDLTIDPHRYKDAYSMTVALQVYRGLLRYSAQGDVLPDLAESWIESDGGRRYVFRLRSAVFSDGTPITAEHVRQSFARIFEVGSEISSHLSYIEGAREFRKSRDPSVLGIRALSPGEVEFRLRVPSSLFLRHLAVMDCAVVPMRADRAAAYSGPYRILSATPESIELVRWRDDPLDSANPPRKVVFFRSEEGRGPALALEGRTDTLDDDFVPDEIQKELVGKRGWHRSMSAIAMQSFVIVSPERFDRAERGRLARALDQEALVRGLGIAGIVPAYGLIPQGIPGTLSRAELAGVLPRASSSGRRRRVRLHYQGGSRTYAEAAGLLSSQWSKAGFDVEPVGLPTDELIRRIVARTEDLILVAKVLHYPDGYSLLTYFRSKGENNFFHMSDADVDRAIDALPEIPDAATRERRYRELQLRILKGFTYLPLFFGTDTSGLWSPRVRRIPPHPLGLSSLPLETVELAP